MKIFVVGGDGFCGWPTSLHLSNLGHDVTIVDDYLPDELFAAFIDRADVVVLPYKSATQSGVIQAAFGRDTPVITTDVGGLAEVVENGRNGIILPAEDIFSLATTLMNYSSLDFNLKGHFSDDCFSWNQLLAILD